MKNIFWSDNILNFNVSAQNQVNVSKFVIFITRLQYELID